jgi:pimeloyl-ACP methyl ester carboxylesterase
MKEAGNTKAVVVLVAGGFGLLKFRSAESGVQWEEKAADFLVRNKDRFLDHETAVAILDVPSDQLGYGYTPKIRKSAGHMQDLHAVISDIKSRLPGSKVFLIGNSQGSTSVAYAGKVLGKEVDGIILAASVFDWAPPAWRLLYDSNLSDFDLSQILSRLLIVHHADDRCVATTYSSAVKLAEKYPFIKVKGGEPVQDNNCGPLGPHGFLGREEPVVTEIKNWIHGRPYKADIQ